jgi:hypothetical protein
LQNQGQRLPAVPVSLDKEQHKLTNSFLTYKHTTLSVRQVNVTGKHSVWNLELDMCLNLRSHFTNVT